MKSSLFRSFARAAAAVSVAALLGTQSAMAAGFFNNQSLILTKNAVTNVFSTQAVNALTNTTKTQVATGPSNQSATTITGTTANATSVINASAANNTFVIQQ